ncbi:MAG TPA: hypothetical protein VGM23_14585 [Armatimonadota bacterium]
MLKIVLICAILLSFGLQAAAASLAITRVWPEKIVTKPGETAVITVDVANTGKTDETATVALAIRYGLDERDTLPPQALTVPAEKTATTHFSYPVPAGRKWGHEAVATLIDAAGALISSGHDYFTVGANPWELGHYITCFMMRGAKASGRIDKTQLPGWRKNYITTFEGYSWEPSVFDGMAPDVDSWRSGQGNYKESKEDWQYLLQQAHKQGIAGVTYIQSVSYGPAGIDFARRHPDWLTYNAKGRPPANFNVAQLTACRDQPEEQGFGTFGGVTTGCFLPSKLLVGDWWIDQVIKSVEMFGWDGFRSDGNPNVVNGYDIAGTLVEQEKGHDYNAEFLRKVRQRLTARFPHFLFGWNNVAGGYPEIYNSAAEEAVMLKDAYSLNEFFRGAVQPNSPFHPWKKAVFYLQQEADAVRNGGGFPHAGWMGSNRYLEAITSACGTHLDTPDASGYRRFEFRWSEFLWDNTLRFVRPAESAVTVTGSDAVWWKDFVQSREMPGGGKRVTVNLVNMPEKDDDGWAGKAPAPAANVTVMFTTPPGLILKKLMALSPDTDGDVIPLTPAANGAITLPKIVVWTLVVAEFGK